MSVEDSAGTDSAALFTWIPNPNVGEGPPTDLGHSSLQIGGLYVSFWPEMDSLIGVLIQPGHPRGQRNPRSYLDECDPDGPFMRRPPEFVDRLEGLSFERMRARWNELADSPYDPRTANCSHLALEVIRAGVPPVVAAELDPGSAPEPAAEDVWARIRSLLAAPFTDCTPEKLRALVLQVLEAENLKSPLGP